MEGNDDMTADLQKASMWKRISAFLFDAILLGIVAVLFAWTLSAATGYDGHNATLTACYDQYAAEYGVDWNMSLAEYEALTPEALKNLDAAYAALGADETAVCAYNTLIQLTFLITTLGILLGYLVVEFAVPLLLKNGQTLGKKVFGVAVMRADGVRLSPVALLARTVLGKYTLETMIPVYILMMLYFNSIGVVGTVVLIALLLLDVILPFATRNHTPIHDLIAGTIVVDMGSQRIFDSKEELVAFMQKRHAEKVAAQTEE